MQWATTVATHIFPEHVSSCFLKIIRMCGWCFLLSSLRSNVSAVTGLWSASIWALGFFMMYSVLKVRYSALYPRSRYGDVSFSWLAPNKTAGLMADALQPALCSFAKTISRPSVSVTKDLPKLAWSIGNRLSASTWAINFQLGKCVCRTIGSLAWPELVFVIVSTLQPTFVR